MILGERRATGGHRAGHTCRRETYDVGVALAHDGLTRVDDVLLRPVEPVEHSALRIDRCIVAGVLVLRPVASRKDASPEPDRLAAVVVDREQHTAPEEVVLATARVDRAQPRCAQVVVAQLEESTEQVPALVVGRGPSDLVPPNRLTIEATGTKVFAGLTGIGRFEEARVVPLDRAPHGIDELRTALAGLVLAAFGVAQCDAVLVGKPFDRTDEIELFLLAHEGDDVARLLTTEAVIEALLTVHRERRRFLGMERTKPLPTPAHAFEHGVAAHDLHDVGRGTHLGDVVVLDGHGGNLPAPPHTRAGRTTAPRRPIAAQRLRSTAWAAARRATGTR